MNLPTIETLAQEVKELRNRIDVLTTERAEDATKHLEMHSGDHAMREAMLQFTQEVAARVGHPVELFVSRFHAAADWHRDRFLRMVEGIDPLLAARIDTRNLTDIPTDDQPPCILPG